MPINLMAEKLQAEKDLAIANSQLHTKTLPFGTKVKVLNVSNGKTVKVRVNDRGPFVSGRVIDLSKKAAKKIGIDKVGVGNVEISYKK